MTTQVNGSQAHDDLVPLFSAGLIGLYSEVGGLDLGTNTLNSGCFQVPLPVSDINTFLLGLLNVAITGENLEKREALAHVVSSVVNKHPNGKKVSFRKTLLTFN